MLRTFPSLFILLIILSNSAFSQKIGLAESVEHIGRDITFTINVEAFPDNPTTTVGDTLRYVQVIKDLDAIFGAGNYSISSPPSVTGNLCANPSFDGSSNTDLLLNSSGCFLAIGSTAEISFGVSLSSVVDLGSGVGMYSSQSSGVGRLLSYTSDVDDLSDWGTDPDPNENNDPSDSGEDDPTLIDITQNPIIGLAKSASLNGNEVTFNFYLENFGNRDLEEIRIIDDLDAAFGSGNYSVTSAPSFFDDPGTLTLNSGFDGSADVELIASGTLSTTETAGIQITVDVTNVVDLGKGLGVYENQAKATAQSSTRKQVEDLSDDGTDPDPNGNGNPSEEGVREGEGENDPTKITIGEQPVIGVAKNVTVSVDSVIIDLYLENLGNTVLSNISLTENLKSVFGSGNFNIRSKRILDASSTLVLNASFNENTNFEMLETSSTLAIGEVDTIQIIVENIILSDQGFGTGVYQNQVFASATAPSGATTNDYSDDGTDADPNGNGNPKDAGEDDKTSFSITSNPKIGIALEYRIGSSSQHVELIYHLENLGNESLTNITISQDLDAVYGSGNYIHIEDPTQVSGNSGLIFNESFNGSTNTTLLKSGSSLGAGESVSFRISHFISTISDQGSGLGIYTDQVTVNATSPNSTSVNDLSDEGTIPDSNDNGEANETGENDATTIDVTSTPSIGIALDANVSGNMVTLDVYLENLGDLSFSELSVTANLDQVFGEGNYILSTPTIIDDPGTINLNSAYDGGAEDLIDISTSTFAENETAQIRIIVSVDSLKNVGLGLGNYSAQFSVFAINTYGGANEDQSDFGTDPDPNGNDNADESGENDATTFNIGVSAVGIAQDVLIVGQNVTIDLYLENFASETLSSISLLQDLDAVFGESNYSITAAPSFIVDPGTFVLNGAFDGSSVTDILLTSSTLGDGATAQIRLSVQVLNESDQGNGFGVYSSQASVYATNSTGTVISDLSDDGTDPDPNGNSDPSEAGEEDASSIIIVGNPSIGIAKHAIVNGTQVTLFFTIENLGNSTLNNVFLQDPLNGVFGSGNYSIMSQPSLVSGPSTLILNPQFFGFNIFDRIIVGGYIQPGERIVIKTTINVNTVSDQGNGFGVYHNGVTINSQDPAGNPIDDISDAGFEPDSSGNGSAGDSGENDVTVITIGDEANIGIALDANVTGTEVTFDYYLENFGSSVLNNIDLSNDLDEVFGSGNYSISSPPSFEQDPGTLTLNASFDGSGSQSLITSGDLGVTSTAKIRVVVNVNTLIDKGEGIGKYSNQVSISASAPLGSLTSDLSDSGVEPDSTGNDVPFDDGEGDPTKFTVNFSSIGLAQEASVDCEAIVTLNYYIRNLGTSQLDSVGLEQSLDDIFGSGQYQIVETPRFQTEERGLVLNEGYNGSSDIQILSPASTITAIGAGSEIVSIKVKVLNPTLTTYKSGAKVIATNNADGQFLDFSDAGTNPDANGNSLANEVGENDSTTINIYAPLKLTLNSQTNVSCNAGSNGAVDFDVSGGKTNYIYSWSNGASTQDITGLSAGTYSVSVMDANSCTATASVTITEPAVLVASIIGAANVSCNGIADGTINLSVTGGTKLSGETTNYNYSWSNSATTEDLSGLVAGTYSVTVTDANSCTATASVSIIEPTVLVASLSSQTNVSCNGGNNGAIALSVTGGTTNYTYSWNNSATTEDLSGLMAGTYSVTVTDANSCTATASVSITEPTVLVASLSSQTNVSCNGGSNGAIDLNVSGGTTNYTYSWSNSATTEDISGLMAGTYSVTVTDANSCTSTASVSITEPAVLVASLSSQTNVSCNGGNNGAIALSITGGTTNYTYSWSNSATTEDLSGLVAGTYSVTVTDANSCTATASVAITEPAVLAVSIISQTNVSCNGGNNGAIDLSVTGGTTNYTYSWNNSATTEDLSGLMAGTYSVTVTDANSCTATASVSITEPTVLVASIISQTNVSCNGGNNGAIDLSVTGGTTNYTYSWNNSATTEDLSGLMAGTYSVTVTDANSCTATASVSITEPAVLVASLSSQTNVSCNGGNSGAIDLSITGGTTNYTYSWSNSATTEDLSGLVAGTYSVTVTDANSCTATASVAITEPAVLAVSIISQTNVSCNGGNNGAIALSVTGGTTSYTYSWSNSATTEDLSGLVAGTYSVTVTDANSCTATASVTITEPNAPLLATVTGQANVSCNGGSNGAIDLNVSGGTTNYTYSWSNSATTEDLSGLMAGTYSVTVTDANSCTATASVSITEPAVLVATLSSQTNVSCNGESNGAIDLSVTGGTTNYTYSWSNSATTEDLSGLMAGIYSVTVTDANSCTATASVSITEPTVLVASLSSQANVSCNGGSNGSIDLNVSGGTTNYTYSWSNSATTEDLSGLVAGTYSVTVTDANSCTATASVTITEPAVLAASIISQTNVSCNGGNNGAIDLSVTGGTTSYIYSWSNSATTEDLSGLMAGTYSVTVTDANSCTATASVTITEPAVLVASITGTTNVSCNGIADGKINLSVTGGTTNYNYSWSNSATTEDLSGLVAGTYSVTVTDANSCTATASVTITEPAVLAASIISQTNVSCNGGNNGAIDLNVNGGTTNYTYSWSNSATTEDLSGLMAGTYSVTVTDANSCTATTASVSITEPTVLVASLSSQTNVSCNGGNNGAIDLNVSGGTTNYIYSWSNSATTQDLSGLLAGIYSVTVTDANSCTATASVSITEPTVLVATLSSQTNVSCNGGNNGAIDLNVSGGTTNYTYSWSNSATTEDLSGLMAGTYSVTVTDANSCTATASVSITEPSLPTLSILSSSNSSGCTVEDGSIVFNTSNVSNGTYTLNYNYQGEAVSAEIDLVSNGFSLINLPSGTYHSFSLDFGVCPVPLVQTIELIGPAFQTTASNTGPYEMGEKIQLMIASGVEFSWAGPNGFYSSIQSPTIDPAKEENAGHYEAIVKGANNCIDTVSTDVVVNCLPANISYYITYAGPGQNPEVISELTENLKVQINPNRPVTVLAYPNCSVNNIESMKLSLSGTSEIQYHEDNEEIYALHDGPSYIGADYLSKNLYTFIGTAYDQDDVMGNEIIGPDVTQFYMVSGSRAISEPTLSKEIFCNGESFTINVDSVGEFVSGNLFKVYLSDKDGSFLKPRQIGFSNNPNQINCTLPLDLFSGTGYKIKITSSDPVVTSLVSSESLNIIGKDLTLVSSQDDILGSTTAGYAVESIKASNDIKNNGNVEFNAGKNIQLEPGFEVESGSVFKAELKSICPN